MDATFITEMIISRSKQICLTPNRLEITKMALFTREAIVRRTDREYRIFDILKSRATY